MAIPRKLQYIECLREFAQNPPASFPADLLATMQAAVAAYAGCSKAKRKKWRQDVRDATVVDMPVHIQALIQAAIDADIAADTGVN